MEQLLIKGMNLETASGKQVILNGINYVCKEKEKGYFYPGMEESFRAFQEMGFNLIRLGIFWDGVEPEPGNYDRTYLGKVKAAIVLAEKYGLYVILDMHQDLFSVKYADGAPEWATLDEGACHPADCTMWYDAYLRSEAVIKAADHFWENRKASDGTGLLDHYGAMWETIAEALDGCGNLIGWEPMNEPFMGSLAGKAFGTATARIRERFPEFDVGRPDLVPMEQQIEFMGYVTECLQDFDRTTLMDFYRRMQDSVGHFSRKPLVTGGNIYSSSNVTTGIGRLNGEGSQIYAPHGYDSVVDSDRYESFSRETVEYLFADKRTSQLRLGLPLIVGEWGAFPSKSFTNDLIRHMNGILENYLWGSAYWCYAPGLETDENYQALSRAYPMETAGELIRYHYDDGKKKFEMEYEAAEGGTSRIYLPFRPDGGLEQTPEDGLHIVYQRTGYGNEGYEAFVTAEKGRRVKLVIAQAAFGIRKGTRCGGDAFF